MSRRFAAIGGNRRGARGAASSGGVAPNVMTFAGILGANLLAEFDARVLSSAGSWTDRRRGYVATSPGTSTTYAADSTHFNGLAVHQCAITGSADLRLLVPSPALWNTGDKPYVFGVARFRTYGAGFNILFKVANAAGTTNSMVLLTGNSTQLLGVSETSGNATATFSDTTAPHTFEVYLDSAGTVRVSIDGAASASAGTGVSLLTDSGYITFGGNQIASANLTDTSHALWLFCRSVPTDVQRAQIRALARSIWAF